MCGNEQNEKFLKKRYFFTNLCLIFSIINIILTGVFAVLGFVGIVLLSKELFLIIEYFHKVSFVVCLLTLVISIVMAFQCKKLFKNNLHPKLKTRIIATLICSSYNFLIFVFAFIEIIVRQ